MKIKLIKGHCEQFTCDDYNDIIKFIPRDSSEWTEISKEDYDILRKEVDQSNLNNRYGNSEFHVLITQTTEEYVYNKIDSMREIIQEENRKAELKRKAQEEARKKKAAEDAKKAALAKAKRDATKKEKLLKQLLKIEEAEKLGKAKNGI